mgnify:CR=1 FL=1
MVLIFLSFSAFNYVVDPYGIHQFFKKEGFNLNKPAMKSHLRMSKAYAVRNQKPKSIILGTSRAEFGLDPDHEGFIYFPTYNLNLSGGNTYEMLRYFQHANAVSDIKQTILALDFFQFDINNQNSPDFSEERLAVDILGNPTNFMPMNDILDSLFAFDTLISSIDTVFSQTEKPTYLRNGLLDPTTTRRVKLLDIIGQRRLFLNNEERYFKKTYKNFSLEIPDKNLNSLEHYRQLLSIAYKTNMDLRILINPAHARQLETLYQSDLWEIFEFWKTKLTEINEMEARISNKQPYPIWDFSGFNIYTTETVPSIYDLKSRMQWYWESSHFKKELGDKVLNTVLFNQFDQMEVESFGVKINSSNIYLHNSSVRENHKVWKNKNPQDVKEIKNLNNLEMNY